MSVPGTWQLTMNTPMGKQTPTLTISEEGGSYKGTLTNPQGTSDLEEITIDGVNFSFSVEVPTPMGKIKMGVSGAVDGDSISGNFKTPMGPTPFTGERK